MLVVRGDQVRAVFDRSEIQQRAARDAREVRLRLAVDAQPRNPAVRIDVHAQMRIGARIAGVRRGADGKLHAPRQHAQMLIFRPHSEAVTDRAAFLISADIENLVDLSHGTAALRGRIRRMT